MKPKEVAYIPGYEIIGPTANRSRKELVIIGIAAHFDFWQVDHDLRKFPQYKGHIENTVAQAVPVANVWAVENFDNLFIYRRAG
jgi:hypothetical protein